MYSKTTEDINGSNEDLIGAQRTADDAFDYAQLQLGGDEMNTGLAPYVVVANNSPRKSRSKNRQLFLILVFVLLVLLCIVFISLYVSKKTEVQLLKKQASEKSVPCTSPGCVDVSSFMHTAMDPKVKPCDNFYQYACGGWLAKNPIPEEQQRWGVDSVLVNQNLYALRHLMEQGQRSGTQAADENDAQQKAMHFYESCMKTDAIKKAGKTPLLDLLKKFDDSYGKSGDRSIKKILTEKLVLLERNYAVNALFGTFVEVDARNSSSNVIQVTQGGLFLSQTHYDANITDKVPAAYIKYMYDVLVLLGAKSGNETKKFVRNIYNFEKTLAKNFVPQENMTDIDKTYNKMTINDLQKICPMIDWLSFYSQSFAGLSKISAEKEIIVLGKPYLQKLSDVIKGATDATLFGYIRWKIIASFVPYLSDEFRALRKGLQIALFGTSLSIPRWRMCIQETDATLGFALGAMFVKHNFPGDSKKVVAEMVEDLRNAFIQSLPSIKWMDDTTRWAAKDKALSVFSKIGYPDMIMDYKKLNEMYKDMRVTATDYFQNVVARRVWASNENRKQLERPVDKTVWYMTPSTVNAYYDATRNQIVFPAGILQRPYFDVKYPMAVNYGGIGAVIGHELLHGFDNNGRLFDKYGNSGKLWWTKHAVEEFKKKEQCFVKEYSDYIIKGKHINGKLTLGENIADNGGLKAAYHAYKSWVQRNGDEPTLPGMKISNEQAFFVSFAQSWCTSARTAAVWEQLKTDTHSPAMDRVLGSISNSYEFARAFSCPVGSKYNPTKKCDIW